MNRTEDLAALRSGDPWDLLVVGGGIAGAGVALEAARAGAKVALVEARDFAGGTSSRSSKLVHGGLRYLGQGRIGLTRESLHERDALLAQAGGLVRPLRFVLPVRQGAKPGRRKLALGLGLYDALAGQRTRRWHDAAGVLGQAPGLDAHELLGGWSYLDAQADDARLVLRVLAEARRLGARMLNHLRVDALLCADRPTGSGSLVQGARLVDTVSGEGFDLHARCVVNATGVWADVLRGQLGHAPMLRPLRGSHLLLPDWRLPLSQAVGLFHPLDQRPVFALPWEGATLVGTTDLDHHDDLAHEPGITRAELDYLMQALRHAFPALALAEADVRSTWSGVRPVVGSGRDVAPSSEPREHLVLDEQGLVTVTGGKLTTFRSTARQVLRCAARHVPVLATAPPDDTVLAPTSAATPVALAPLPPALRERWIARFGDLAPALLQTARPGELRTIANTGIAWAELRWACRHEAVVHLDDLLLRRTRLGLLLRDGAAELAAQLQPLVQQELGWPDEQWQREWTRYQALIARCYALPPRAADAAALGKPA
ncbi:MAG TPA: glycerol-3-phosphate dehydrogenase/oxidase [Ideonella sp.]|uniref:glycerol-3-phosphate dehydrogenase/oxidase n=1 Tax=Ideonella sp. TaxID=1929293 RepID=UPI002E36F5EC|nr:glycerol-3-phosphate dehydrogenase/oxidase [Ideonella sp.]HEX5686418.1 glycerol-3-phosphate dehydrogenase/oxidase [Ideonella sp.]